VPELGAVIRARLEQWGAVRLPLERAVFGTDDPDVIASAVDSWCADHLDAPVDHYEFFDSSSGSVHGVTLADGRRVVVKVHRATVSTTYLDALARVQRAFADAGWATPRPLVRDDHITAETMLGPFPKLDGHDPSVRRVLAQGLAALVRDASALDRRDLEHPLTPAPGELYPPPHSERFDFAATQPGAEWIDEFTRVTVARAQHAPTTIAHGDWRIDNVRVVDGRIAAVYDWDSVGLLRETAVVANAATTFSVDWQRPGGNRFPAPAEIAAFIAEYEDARGSSLDPDELVVGLLATLTYGARCEHADRSEHAATDDSFTGLLRGLGARMLRDGLAVLG